MLAWCCAAAPSASAEVVQTKAERPGLAPPYPRTAIGQQELGEEGVPCLAPPSPRTVISMQLDRMAQKRTDDRGSSESTEERNLDPDLDGPASKQITKEERFPRWNPLANSVPRIGDKDLPMVRDLESMDDASPAGWAACPFQRSSSPRSCNEMPREGAAQTKEERLHEQVRIFVTKAQKGMSVYLCDTESLLLSQCLFRIDETATTLTLQTALAREQELQLKNLKSVVKGEALKKKAPRLAHASGECLMLVFGDASEETLRCLFFKDVKDRNDFHTSMKVVQVMATRGTV